MYLPFSILKTKLSHSNSATYSMIQSKTAASQASHIIRVRATTFSFTSGKTSMDFKDIIVIYIYIIHK